MKDPANFQIILLAKKQYRQFKLHFQYLTDSSYDVQRDSKGLFTITLVKKPLGKLIQKEFTGHLYDDHLENPTAFALIHDEQTIGYLEIDRYEWNNRLRVTELLILPDFRGQGAGTLLMNHAKQVAQAEHYREIILETQTCNTRAIDFYLKQGFAVNGIDLSCYTNADIENHEVRLEMVFRPQGALSNG